MKATLLEHAVDLIRQPTPQKAMELDRLIRESETSAEAEENEHLWRSSEYFRKAVEERYIPAPYDISQLASLPQDSLGETFARHMVRYQLDPVFYEGVAATSDALFVRQRVYQTHDIMHCLLDYSTSVLDETGITGFYFGQQDRYHPPGGGAVMIHSVIQESAVFMHAALSDPEHARLSVRSFIEGYRRGWAARPFLSVRLEELWAEPIADVRELLGISERAEPVA